MQNWFYSADEEKQGPVTREELLNLAASGKIKPDTLVWTAPWPQWKKFSECQTEFSMQANTQTNMQNSPSMTPHQFLYIPGAIIMSDDEYQHYFQNLSQQELYLFNHLYDTGKKKTSSAYILLIFLGGIGIHRFYLKSTGMGILYIGLTITSILILPAIAELALAIMDLVTLPEQVKKYNLNLGKSIIAYIVSNRNKQ